MDLSEYYKVLARQTQPNVSDDDITSQLAGVDQDKLKSALGSLVPTDPSTDPLNTLGSSYDVDVSDNTATAKGGGLQPPMSQMDMDDAGMKSLAPEVPYGKDTPPSPLGRFGDDEATPTPPQIPQPSAPIEPNTPESASKSGGKGQVSPSPLSSILAAPTASDSQDSDKRLEAEKKESMLKKVGAVASLGAGIGDAIGNAAVPYGGKGSSGTQEKVMADTDKMVQDVRTKSEENLRKDPASDVSKGYRQMVLQIAPDLAKNPSFATMSAQAIGDKLPLIDTMMKARAQEDARKIGLAQVQATHDANAGYKHDTEQDRIEQQAKQGFLSMRGDQSLQRVENQRDAAIQAYNTIEQVKKEGRVPSQIEYYDLLGQMWKARTGSAPTDQAIRDLDAKTLKGSLAKAAQYFTGKPAGMTTQDILNNIQDFAKHSGQQADQLHDAYMKTRMVKPQGLDESRWDPLANAGRGLSFADATKSLADKAVPTVVSQQDYERLPSGASYKDANGKTYRKK